MKATKGCPKVRSISDLTTNASFGSVSIKSYLEAAEYEPSCIGTLDFSMCFLEAVKDMLCKSSESLAFWYRDVSVCFRISSTSFRVGQKILIGMAFVI